MTPLSRGLTESALPRGLTGSALQIRPLEPTPGSSVDFGAEIAACDLANLSDEDFEALSRAVLTYHVVVIRGQGGLTPQQQYELTRRFDPTVQTYGHGHDKDLLKKSVLVQDLISIPEVPQVQLIGNGEIEDHEGVARATLRHPSHQTFHQQPLSAELERQDFTRFYRWHIDAALYKLQPPKVTTLLALQVPESRPQTVLYDDGSGDTLSVPLAATVFVSGSRAFRDLTPAQQDYALRTQVRYAPHPYVWIKQARAHSTGLGIVSEGKELSRADLPPHREEEIATLPLVWVNPLTGERALQAHACCVEQLITDGVALTDLDACRRIIYELMRPGIAPTKVYAHAWLPGDLVIFNNRGVWHSVVGALRPNDRRVYHQCNLASNEPPLGPTALSA